MIRVYSASTRAITLQNKKNYRRHQVLYIFRNVQIFCEKKLRKIRGSPRYIRVPKSQIQAGVHYQSTCDPFHAMPDIRTELFFTIIHIMQSILKCSTIALSVPASNSKCGFSGGRLPPRSSIKSRKIAAFYAGTTQDAWRAAI